jgi:hypothetical protein
MNFNIINQRSEEMFEKIKSGLIVGLLLACFTSAVAEIALPNVGPVPSNPQPEVKADKDSSEKVTSEMKFDELQFLNGDRLRGDLGAVSFKDGLVWKSPYAFKDIMFKLDSVKEVLLKKNNKASQAKSEIIYLVNGDSLKGKIVSLGKDELLLSTSYGGELKIGRNTIKEIVCGLGDKIIYDGPVDLKNWKVQSRYGKIKIEDEVMTLPNQAFCGNDVKIPDRAKIEFVLGENINQASVFLYMDDLQRYRGNCYVLSISRGYINMQRYTQNRGSNNIGQCQTQLLNNANKKNRFTLLVDKKKKTFALFINGKLVKQFSDTVDFDGKGTGLGFYNQSGMSLEISKIQVSDWDGRMPALSSGDAENLKDTVIFINDDKVSGKLESISNGKVIFKTEFAPLTVPIERIKCLRTPQKKTDEKPEKINNQIKLFFTNDDFVTISLDRIDNGEVLGESRGFGKVKFKLSAFKKILFNVKEELDLDEAKEEVSEE